MFKGNFIAVDNSWDLALSPVKPMGFGYNNIGCCVLGVGKSNDRTSSNCLSFPDALQVEDTVERACRAATPTVSRPGHTACLKRGPDCLSHPQSLALGPEVKVFKFSIFFFFFSLFSLAVGF